MTEEISVRDQLIGILRTRYAYGFRFCEDLDRLIFGQEREGAISTLKDLFAFKSIPFTDGVPEIEYEPRDSQIEYLRAGKAISNLAHSEGLDCCDVFKGTADEVAVIAYDKLLKVGESGVSARTLFLKFLLESKHIPYADVREELCNALQPDEWVESVASVPELFGELSAMFNQGDGNMKTLKLASWLAMVECDQKTRTALIGMALSCLNAGVKEEKSILSGMHIITIG
jgi:hypothetical protein